MISRSLAAHSLTSLIALTSEPFVNNLNYPHNITLILIILPHDPHISRRCPSSTLARGLHARSGEQAANFRIARIGSSMHAHTYM